MESVVIWAAAVCQALVGAIFLIAGMVKVGSLGDFAATIEALGFRLGARVLGTIVILGELVVGVGLVVVPAAAWPRALAGAAAVGFAASGLRALTLTEPIPCLCWGSHGSGRLGWRQIASLPAWLAGLALVQFHPGGWRSEQGLFAMTLLFLALAAIRFMRGSQVRAQLRQNRLDIVLPIGGYPEVR